MDDRHLSYITKLNRGRGGRKKTKKKNPQVVTSLEKPLLFPTKVRNLFSCPNSLGTFECEDRVSK
jgi:hypothetical protein